MGELTATEQALVAAVHDALDADPEGTVRLIARAMQERGMRALIVGSRSGSSPTVAITLTIDDVTSEAVRRVVVPVLRKAGVPEEAIPVMAGSAGAVVSQWLAKQRARQQQQQATASAACAPPPQGPPRWSPGRRR